MIVQDDIDVHIWEVLWAPSMNAQVPYMIYKFVGSRVRDPVVRLKRILATITDQLKEEL